MAYKKRLYLYLLIEFQSTVDKYMAVRIMTYMGLLYQDLVRTKQILRRGRLPPILPIVLYNGKNKWTAATDIAEQIPKLPDTLDIFRPHVRYLLIEERKYTEAQLAPLHNLTAAIFRLEQMPNIEGVREIISNFNFWLDAPEQQELGRSIAIWLRALLAQHEEYPLVLPEIDNIQELSSMLSENMGKWARQYKHEGRQEGHQEGLQTGLQKGRQEGRQEGESRILLKLLRLRFGDIPTWVQQRLGEAETGQIESWSERVLTAASVEAVFE